MGRSSKSTNTAAAAAEAVKTAPLAAPDAGGAVAKKKHRYHAGTVAERKTIQARRSTGRILQKERVKRVVKAVAGDDFKLKKNVLSHFLAGTEAYVARLFTMASVLAAYKGVNTVTPVELQVIELLQKEMRGLPIVQ